MNDIKKNNALQFYKRIPLKMNDIKKNLIHFNFIRESL